MVRFSPSSRFVFLKQQHQLTLQAILSVCVGVIAGLTGNVLAQDAWGQQRYQSPQPAADRSQVFSSGHYTVPAGDWSSSQSRRSPFFDYRYDQPASSQFNSSREAQCNDGGMYNGPGACSGLNTATAPGTIGCISPYASQSYGTPPPAGIDPRFPTPYAGSLYGSISPYDPAAGGTPGGFSSPGPVPTGNLDPYIAGGRGDCVLYMPFTSMGYFGGTTPSSGVSELFVPLLQSHTTLLYADVRGMYNTQSAYQGSFGSGLRTLVLDSMILGGYGFYDYCDSAQHNPFQQASVGVEMLTWIWEARSNGYLPTSQGSNSSGGGAGPAFLQNGLIFLNGTQQRALSGVDAEFGMLVAANPTAQRELRAFAGGYNFNGTNGGSDIPGVYGRLEARIYDLNFLGQGSRLEMGVISSYDDVNKYQVTGLLNLRIAFGGTNCPGGMSLIERRMLDRIVRRQQVVTSSQSSPLEVASTTINGNQYNSVLLVDPTTPNLQAAINAAPSHRLIVVEGGSGTLVVPNGITLNPGQALVGGGTPLTVTGSSTGHVEVLNLPGSTPTIDRPNANGPLITMSTNTSVVGVNLVGGMPGIFADSANNLLVSDVNFSQCMCDGMQFISVNGLTINNVTITQLDHLGVLFENVQNTSISNLSISSATGSSIFYDGGSNVQITGLRIDATGATDDAVKFLGVTNATLTNSQISNTTGNYNALTMNSSAGLTFNQISLTNITGDGLVIENSSMLSMSSSIFTNVNNDIAFIGTLSQISGSSNTSTGQTTLFTGTTSGGGSIQFTSPNATAQ